MIEEIRESRNISIFSLNHGETTVQRLCVIVWECVGVSE